MRTHAITLAEGFGDSRPPRIIAPLQHMFDPIVGVTHMAWPASRWGSSRVPLSRFSEAPRIVFDRIPALPGELLEDMLYHLQRRLMEETLLIADGGPAAGALRSALPA